ncbi:VOC family protein [Jatrophihabitans sp. DSM 45814]
MDAANAANAGCANLERVTPMALVKRLDHVIVAVRDRTEWISLIQRILALEPGRMLEGAGQGASSFSNAEFAIGDGFLGVVTPAGDQSQIGQFLTKFGDGLYGMSIDVGDVGLAVATFVAEGVDHRQWEGGGLLFAGPRQTHGVLYQVIDGMLLGQGANPRYLGLAEFTIAVQDLDKAVSDYQRIFEFGAPEFFENDPPGTRGAAFALSGMDVEQKLVLVASIEDDSDVATRIATRGEGLYSFAIACSDVAAESARLQAIGVPVEQTAGGALIDPLAMRGLRIKLKQT